MCIITKPPFLGKPPPSILVFVTPPPSKSQIFHSVSSLTPSYLLKVTKFFKLNISDFNYFLCKNCNPSP